MIYITTKELAQSMNCSLRTAQYYIQKVNKKIKEAGGMTRKGMAPRKLVEQMLFIDLSEGSADNGK